MRTHFARKFKPLALAVGGSLLLSVIAGCDRPANSPAPSPSATNNVGNAVTIPTQIVAQLAAINVTNGPVTAPQLAEWKSGFTQLLAAGPAAIPAIEAFLLKNVDVGFEPHGNAQLLGAASLRLALISASTRIGGSDAVALAGRILAATADPQELALVAGFLQQVEPGKHHAACATAARETLAIAASGSWDGRDVAPLFAMLKTFGSTNDVGELTRYANTWFAYTAITLAQWPDGAGIPALIRIVQNADGRVTLGRDVYCRMLAEAAATSTLAADVLVAEVKRNALEVGTWPAVGRALAGESLRLPEFFTASTNAVAVAPGARTYHLSVGNQNYREESPAANTTPKELGARLALVDRLLEATTNPAAIDAFEAARVALASRLPKPR